jgi:DNA-binding PadR family transcriptional regulator
MHGFEVLRLISDASRGDLIAEQGALYPALHRLEKRGWLGSEWAVSEKGRKAKYYIITATGKKALSKELDAWGRYVTAVERVVMEEGTA